MGYTIDYRRVKNKNPQKNKKNIVCKYHAKKNISIWHSFCSDDIETQSQFQMVGLGGTSFVGETP
jgi:hypothetical protein